MPPRAAKSILKKYWNRTIPVDAEMLKSFAAKMQVRVLAHVRSDAYSGEYLPAGAKPGSAPCIVFNIRQPVARQGYVLAHCLGHHALGHGKRPQETAYSPHTSDQREKEADAFAAELLLPEDAVREYIHHLHMQGSVPVELFSRHFHVEPALMLFRLHSLGIETGRLVLSRLTRISAQSHEKSKLHASNFYHGKVLTPGFR